MNIAVRQQDVWRFLFARKLVAQGRCFFALENKDNPPVWKAQKLHWT